MPVPRCRLTWLTVLLCQVKLLYVSCGWLQSKWWGRKVDRSLGFVSNHLNERRIATAHNETEAVSCLGLALLHRIKAPTGHRLYLVPGTCFFRCVVRACPAAVKCSCFSCH